MQNPTYRPSVKKRIKEDNSTREIFDLILADPFNPHRNLIYKIPRGTDRRSLKNLIKLSNTGVDIDLDMVKSLLNLEGENIKIEVILKIFF